MQYWTPKWGGFSGRIAYAANEGKSSDPAPAGQAETDPYLWSLLLQYDFPIVSLRYGYERHNDYFGLQQLTGSLTGTPTPGIPVSLGGTPTNDSSKDDGHQLVAIFTFGNTRISVLYDHLTYKTDESVFGNIDEYEKESWYVLAQQRFGGHQVFGAYGRADEGDCERVGGVACSTNGLGAKQWFVGYSYAFSKRTDVFALYYQIDKERSAQYGSFPNVGTSAPNGITSPGADTVGYGIGILHSF